MSISEAARIQPQELPLLRFMPRDVRKLIAASFVPQRYAFGDTIVREGEPSDAFYMLVSGRARAVKRGDNGEDVPLNTLFPGDTFGETGLIEDTVRTATVRASSDVEVLRLDGAVFKALLASNQELREYVELAARERALHDFFRLHPPFARLPLDGLTLMLRETEGVEVERGQEIIREGDAPGPMFVVRSGRLRALRDGRNVAFYRAGDYFGERSLFVGEPRSATVEALTDCRLLRVLPETLRRLLDGYPDFRDELALRIAQYTYKQSARMPLDFAEELLPVEAEIEPVGPEQVDEELTVVGREALAEEVLQAEPTRRVRRIRRFPHVWQLDEADCGAACLAMVCQHFGRKIRLSAIRDAVRVGIEGTSLAALARGAEELGLTSRTIKASKRNLDALPLPAVLHWEGNHWIVLFAVGRDRVRVADPALGLRRLPRDELLTRWSGYAALFAPTDAFREAPEEPSRVAWLWPFFRRERRAIASASTLALAVSGLQLTLPVFTQVVVDRVLPRRDFGLLHVLLLALAGVLLVTSGGSLAQRYLLSRAAVRIDSSSLDVLAGRLLSMPMSYFYTRRTGDIQRRLAGLRQVREFVVRSGVTAITGTAQVLAAVVLMFVYSRVLALAYLAAIPVYATLMRIAARWLRPTLDNVEESFGRYYSRQLDAIKGIETVKAGAAEEELRRRLLADFTPLVHRLFRADFLTMLYEGAIQLVAFASLGVFLWLGSLQVLHGHLTIGRLVAFSALVALANAPITLLLNLWDQAQYSAVMLGRLSDVFEHEPEQGADRTRLRPVRTLEGSVRLERVSFRYGGPEAPPVLENLSFEVAPGTTVAIVGRSGSGKTTLARCLAGLIEPTEGRILYDSVDMTTLDYRDLRRRIGVVLQENFLFSDTIAHNISFGAGDPDLERVRWAARVANADEFIERLPLGYETRVGETGLLLSGGQRQRIALARAVYQRPPVLILDEATSSLDAESEKAVKESMDRLLAERTSFVIAHRLSTIRDADVILVLERGSLVEQGTHDELLARKGLYFYLASQQLEL